jgi:hypothetical protein
MADLRAVFSAVIFALVTTVKNGLPGVNDQMPKLRVRA